MNFAHITYPGMYDAGPEARRVLSEKLGFQDSPDFQDWEIQFLDPHRIEAFLALYGSEGLTTDQQFLLMDLILASAAEAPAGIPNDAQWRIIEGALADQYDLHGPTIWKWADIDEETGIPFNDFQISRRMQGLLQRQYEIQFAAGETDLTPLKSDFAAFWESHFEGHTPLAHLLRGTLAERWIRFHSLPDSKRYAETDEEWSVLFDRHDRLAEVVLGDSARCWLVVAHELTTEDTEGDATLSKFDFEHWFDWVDYASPGFEFANPVNAAEVLWLGGQFNALIGQIARWEENFVMFISQATGAIFAPYDGGIDLILPSPNDTENLRTRFPDWLPRNETGL